MRGIFLSVSLVSGVVLVLAVQEMVDSFLSNPMFLVREVEVRWPQGSKGFSDRFRMRPPISIFRVELDSLSRAFQKRYPALEVEEIYRFLPNRLVAGLRARRIVAQIKQGGRYCPLGDDGVILSKGRPAPVSGIPLLELKDSDFRKVSDLLTALQRDHGLAGKNVRTVQVRGKNTVVVLESGPEIRFSTDQLAVEWQRLAELVVRKPDVLETASYLDMRFEDPVIGEKGEKREARRRH